jgi:hypothetical protein
MSGSRGTDAGLGLRLVRGGLIAAATLSVAIWAHSSADGNLPGTAGLIWIWLAATGVTSGFLGRPASYPKIIGLVVGGQFALHLVLSLTAGHGARPMPSALARHYASTSMLDPTAPAPVLGDAEVLTSGLGSLLAELTSVEGLAMTLAHLAGAAAVGLWLATGEQLLWWALRRLALLAGRTAASLLTWVLAALRPLLPPSGPVSPAWPRILVDRRLADWRCVIPRRGPPGFVTI